MRPVCRLNPTRRIHETRAKRVLAVCFLRLCGAHNGPIYPMLLLFLPFFLTFWSYARFDRLLVPLPPGPPCTLAVSVQLMCRWLMKTENAIECGSKCEVFSHGMLRARFSAENRIKHLELVFDVMSLMQQLQRAQGGEGFRVIPNTVRRGIASPMGVCSKKRHEDAFRSC